MGCILVQVTRIPLEAWDWAWDDFVENGEGSVNSTRAEQPETVKDNVTFIDQHTRTKAVLQELYQLLEDYSPVWYTEEHHDRVAGALRGWFPAKSRC
jgi:hypothetical protein